MISHNYENKINSLKCGVCGQSKKINEFFFLKEYSKTYQ